MKRWFEKLFDLFNSSTNVHKDNCNGIEVDELEAQALGKEFVPEPSEFGKLQAKFNAHSDIIVLSEEACSKLTTEEETWLTDKSHKIIMFPGNKLINMAIVRSPGYGW